MEIPSITVQGNASCHKKADVAFIILSLQEQRNSFEEAQQAIQARTTQAERLFRDNFEEIREFRTSRLYIGSGQPARLTRIRRNENENDYCCEIIDSLLVILDISTERILQVIDTAIQNGIQMIIPRLIQREYEGCVVLYGTGKQDSDMQHMFELAYKNAEDRARNYANSINKAIGKALSISSFTMDKRSYRNFDNDENIYRNLLSDFFLSLRADKLHISGNLSVRFEILEQ